eukprot:TRINITY_DN5416_c0_g1_i2.p1 TRINITY_DN5416_c0_g1~~TRINITY_DN5416_c0_g1_i2.p1  ORF type:complete len:750 (-),score=172.75 TRINITY_DN5416_c0_g1_i2:81-2330(-)
MPPPRSLEAARLAGIEAARQASAVYRAVVQSPQGSAPAGWGVETPVFRQALPRLNVGELVNCSRYFGQRGQVVGELAAELAGEVGRRLRSQPDPPSPSEPGAASAAKAVAIEAAGAARSMHSHEVTAVAYSFSKLSPQLPEYALLYDAVAEGLARNAWQLNRLQSALIGTAFADVELRLADALPRVLRPVLSELAASQEARETVTVDELRLLVHASVQLPRQSLLASDVEALADCTERLLPKANFAAQAHLAVAWLRLEPPAAAKKAHLEALQASCQHLMKHKKSHFPAHPLPREGLAPAMAALLAREAEQNAPPLTPPAMRDIAKGLAQISWGLQRYQSSSSQGRSLSIDDWSEILRLVLSFCEAHSARATTSSSAPSGRVLPSWAAELLYHVLWRAQQQALPADDAPGNLVELESLLTLLRFVRQHESKPQPDAAFFSWAAKLVAAHQRRAGTPADLFAEVVSELVPMLPPAERGNVARLLLAGRASTVGVQANLAPLTRHCVLPHAEQASGSVSPRLLAGSASQLAEVKLAGPASQRPEAALEGSAVSHRVGAAPLIQAASGGRLWGMLAAHANSDSTSLQVGQQRPAASMNLCSKKEEAVAVAELAPTAAAAAAEAQAETQRLLQQALRRVEALEVRLKEQEVAQKKARASTPKKSPSNRRDEARAEMHEEVGPMQSTLEQGGAWLANLFPSPAERIQPSPAAATLHLHRGFNFEEYRRAQSGRLQAERLRVLVPPDHFPMWPRK